MPRAENALPPHLARAQMILESLDSKFVPLFVDTDLRLTNNNHAPLARYTPAADPSQKPTIEFRRDLKLYKDDYVMTSSIIDRAVRPNFDQYLVILSALSLANEWTHYYQDTQGALTDLLQARKINDAGTTCALYDLQQYVSDIVMIETAYALDQKFRRANNLTGSLSILMTLEKMWLDDVFLDYRLARTHNNITQIKQALSAMHNKREAINISGLKGCPVSSPAPSLPDDMITRAISPLPAFLQKIIQ